MGQSGEDDMRLSARINRGLARVGLQITELENELLVDCQAALNVIYKDEATAKRKMRYLIRRYARVAELRRVHNENLTARDNMMQ